jgi:hypothetical protein
MPPVIDVPTSAGQQAPAAITELYVAQIEPGIRYSDWLMDRVVEYLQTGDTRIFPFAAAFDVHRRTAFARDLREGLGEINDSGSARKTSATGFIASDLNLRRIVEEWQVANGGWPEGSFPQDPDTALGSSTPSDSPPKSAYLKRVVRS